MEKSQIFCAVCGESAPAAARFCRGCGGEILSPMGAKQGTAGRPATGSLPPLTDPSSPSSPATTEKPRRGLAIVLAIVGVVLLLLVGSAITLAITDDAPSDGQRANKIKPGSTNTTTPTAVSTTTTAPIVPAWTTVGTSLQNRPIRVSKIGTGPRQVLWIGGIHGDEDEGAIATAELTKAFVDAGLGSTVTLTILEDANPDGRANTTRGNANGVDINRNFAARSFSPGCESTGFCHGDRALSEPETRAVTNLLDKTNFDLVLVAHGHTEGPFINFDGRGADAAERFGGATNWQIRDSSQLDPTPGSIGQLVGVDRGQAILTIEWIRGTDPAKAWEMTRAGILEAIAR
ncbi:MAG: DUF2817 domain-containing protein [Acidimicrobiia bacterium]|nr:DUF2817 domain-containing protein [Acidimicrobiia bacterium]